MPFDLSDIGSLIGAGGGIAQSFFGGSEQSATSKKLQKLMMKMMTAGLDDGNGNKVVWDGHNWVTVLSPISQNIARASDTEELQQLTQDMPMQRHERLINSGERDKERAIADTLMSRIIDRSPMTAERLQGDLYDQQAQGINDAYDRVINDVSTQGLRTGNPAGGTIERLAKSLATDLGGARRDARLNSLTMADDINSKRTNDAINQYSVMASRAANGGNVPFNPEQLTTTLLSAQQGAKSQAGSLGYGSLYAGQGVNEPNYFDVGQNVSNLLEGIGSMFSGSNNNSSLGTKLGNTIYKSKKP